MKQKNVENHKLKRNIKKLKLYIKIDKRIIKPDDTEMEKYTFHQHKSTISINNIDINKIVVSNNVPFGKQDFKC